MEMDDPIVIGAESTCLATTYDALIRTADAMKVESDCTPINPDPIIAAADAAQLANIERAANVRSGDAIDEDQPQPTTNRADKTIQRNRMAAPGQPSTSVMDGDLDVTSLDGHVSIVAHYRASRNRLADLKARLNRCPPSVQNPMRRLLRPAVEKEARAFEAVAHYVLNVRKLSPYDSETYSAVWAA